MDGANFALVIELTTLYPERVYTKQMLFVVIYFVVQRVDGLLWPMPSHNAGTTHPSIIPANLNRSKALNQELFGSISSSNPTFLALSKLICLSNVK